MKRFYFPSFLLLLLSACSGDPAKKTPGDSIVTTATQVELAGKVFHFPPPPGIDTATCTILPGVDGPDWFVAFRNDSSFIKIHQIGAEYRTVATGSYRLDGEKIVLEYDSISVTTESTIGQQPSADGNSTVFVNQKRFTVGRKPYPKETLSVHRCDSTHYLKMQITYGEKFTCGTADAQGWPVDKWINHLQTDSTWVLLKPSEK